MPVACKFIVEKEKYEQALIEAEFEAEQRPTASIGKKGTIAAIIALVIAVIVCVILGFKFGGYFVNSSDDPEKESLQEGNSVVDTTPSTTLGRIPELTEKDEPTTKKSEITEYVSGLEDKHLVVNGMSNYARNEKNANSAIYFA